ncbi:hypothetical protein ACFHYQ_14660 [Sphaerimonospora cavernae]|uniref:HNH endonuclease n=1 Tax=Sphaerimonospora cavernae TaxID=1740611 RepID=A0ABV6U4Z1_9ACTN
MATFHVGQQTDSAVLPQRRTLESTSADNPGCATGDLVRAVVPSGKHAGTHIGRVAVRSSGSFNVTTADGTRQGIHHRHVRLLQRADGYAYTWKEEGVSSQP